MRKRFVNRAISLLLTVVMLVGMVPSAFAAIEMGTKPSDGTVSSATTSVTVPFSKGTGDSNSFRIPAMVTLSDGTIVAAADARWNTTYDGGGLDTIVARSGDNGVNWNYTFANYLGDNGNENNASSTAFIDPALAVKTINDIETIFMLVDLYPHGVALNGGPDDYPGYDTGFNSNGNLLLSGDNHSNYDYYLDGTTIRNSGGSAVSGLTVDAYFNITGTYNETTYNTNLFFSDSPFQVARTGFLYLTTSTDKGASWSAPTLIPNLKTADERVCLVGPGRGLVTTKTNGSLPAGTIIFPVYSFDADSSLSEASKEQYTGFIYSSDNGASWARSANFKGASWSSESAVVELSDGTLRFFYRNGTTNLCYVDYANNTWGSPVVETSLDTNSNCQISAITYSKTVNGQQVILVSCPAGPNNAGSDQSGALYRKNGKIFVGLVNTDTNKTISWQTDNTISVASKNSTDSFMYSCLTELKDENGTIAILYEDNEAGWGTGDDKYYQMSYATFELGLTFDEAEQEEEPVNAYFTQDGTNPITALTIDMADSNATVTLANVDTASQTVTATSSNTGVATVSVSDNVLTITPVAAGETTITATVSNALTRAAVAQEYTLSVTVTAETGGEDTGETEEPEDTTVIEPDIPENTNTANGTTGSVTTTTKTVYVLANSISAGKSYLIVNGNSGTRYALAQDNPSVAATAVTVKTGDVDNDGDTETYIELADATDELWTVSGSYKFRNNGYYLQCSNYGTLGLSNSSNTWSYSSNRLSYSSNRTTYYLRYDSGWTATRWSSNATSIYFYIPTEIETTTGTTVEVAYEIEGSVTSDSGTEVTAGSTVTLSATLTTTEDGTTTTEDVDSFTVYDDDYSVIENISDNRVTLTGDVGPALIKVSENVTTSDGTTEIADYIYLKVIKVNYQFDGETIATKTYVVTAPTGTIDLPGTVTYEGIPLGVSEGSLAVQEGEAVYNVALTGARKITINYVYNGETVKTETKLVANNTDEVTLADTVIVDGESYRLTDTTLTLNGETVYEVPVSLTIGITIQYQTENGYTVRTVLESVEDTETSLTLEPTIEGTNGNTYTVTGQTAAFELPLNLSEQTAYTVTVDYIEVPVILTAGSTYQIAHAEGYDDSNLTESITDSYDFTNGTLTVTGVSAGDGGYVIVNANKYVFTVVGELSVEVQAGKTLEIDLSDPAGFNLTLQDGQYVKWESSDSTYAGVAGVYDNVNKVYTDAAVIAGQTVTTDPVIITATVYHADGSIAGEYRWKVTVTEGDVDDDDSVKYVYVEVGKLVDCDLYYSVNGGPLIKVNGEGVVINEAVTGKYFLAIFAAPDHTGALTSMKASNSAGEFSILVNGDPDGVGSDAWPFADSYDWTQYDDYVAENGYPAGSNKTIFDTTCGFRWALAEGNLTAQQYKLMLSNAIDLGCEGAICFTKNATGTSTDDASNSANIHTVLTIVGQDLPSVVKEIYGVSYEIDNGDGTTETKYRSAVNGEWGIKLYDTIIYNLNVHIPAQIESGDANINYGHFTLTNMTLADMIMGKSFTELGGVITCTNGGGYLTNGTTYSSGATLFSSLEQPEEGNSIDLAFTASIQLTPENFNYLFGGVSANEASLLSNMVSLDFSYKSDYASAAASKTDTEEIEAYVWYDTYIVDFGLPTVIDLSSAPYLHGDTDYELTSIVTYLEHYKGQAIVEADLANEKFTYTLLAPLTAYDIAGYTVTNKYDSEDVITYYIYIVPASNMLYEEGFLTAPEESNSFYADWTGVNVSRVNKANSMQGANKTGTNVTPYGYDTAYADETNYSGGYYTTTVNAGQFLSSALTTTVTGTTGFDVIGDAGPNSANLYVLIRANTAGATTRIIVVDTTFEDDTYGMLHQVPLVHVSGLDPDVSYQINISAGYMEKTSAASLTSFGGGSPIFQIYSILYEMGMTDEEIENTEFVGFDDYNSVSFLSDEGVMTAAEGDQTLVIDGFRLYRSTANSAYYSVTNAKGQMVPWEYNAIYTNVSDGDIAGEIFAYVEPNTVTDEGTGTTTDYDTGTYSVAVYDTIGGPQGEIYLPANAGIVFRLESTTVDNPISENDADVITISTAQISARAVTGETTMVSGTGDSAVSTDITTNTEMYYEVSVDENGYISIVNNGENMLAIANVKALSSLAEITGEANAAQAEQAVMLMMATYRAGTSGSQPSNNIVEVTNQYWIDGNGQAVSAIPEDEVSSVYTVQNLTGTEATITLMLGAYDAKGKMLDIQTVSITLLAGEDGELTVTMFLPEGTSEVKSFILDEEMTPLCDSTALNY